MAIERRTWVTVLTSSVVDLRYWYFYLCLQLKNICLLPLSTATAQARRTKE